MYNIMIQFKDRSVQRFKVNYWRTIGNTIILYFSKENNLTNMKIFSLDQILEMDSTYEEVVSK
jgi:hypothetical protein